MQTNDRPSQGPAEGSKVVLLERMLADLDPSVSHSILGLYLLLDLLFSLSLTEQASIGMAPFSGVHLQAGR